MGLPLQGGYIPVNVCLSLIFRVLFVRDFWLESDFFRSSLDRANLDFVVVSLVWLVPSNTDSP